MGYGLTEDDIRTIKSILERCSKVESGIIFGSRAMNTFTVGSDVDIALKGKIDSSTVSKIQFELEEETNLPYFFDVLDYDSIEEPKLTEHIDRYGKVFYLRGWKRISLGNFCNLNPNEKIEKETIAKYVPMENIQPFMRQINKFYFKNFSGGMKFRNGDTLMARITPCLENGKIAYVDFLDKDEVGFGSTEYIVFREKKGISDKLFLYYFVNVPYFRKFSIKSMTGTSGRQRVQHHLLSKKVFLFPKIEEQKAIASILSSFDDKIELLQKENKTLESIAETVFKRWFVDFEFPVNIKNSPPDKGECPKGEGVYNCQAKPDGVVNNKRFLKTFRKQLRNNLTPAEAKLWTYLKGKQLDGRKFRRQHSVDNYILDFYCSSERIAIELDGEAHNNRLRVEYDYERDLFLKYYGIKVLRFENRIVFENPEGLLESIKKEFGWVDLTTPPFRHPSLKGGELLGYKSNGGKMMESEMGEIPEGWRVGSLGDVIDLVYGKGLKTEHRTGYGFPVVGSNGIIGYHDKFLVKGFGIVVGRKGTMGSVIWVENNFYPIDTTFFVKDKMGVKDLFFHFFLLKRQDFRRIGSDSAVPGLNRKSAYSLDIVLPLISIVEKFNKSMKSIFEKNKSNNIQIQELKKLRDTLLPKLISGKIRVKQKTLPLDKGECPKGEGVL